VIRPAVETVVDSQGKRVGVMATEASVRSNAFEEELKKLDPTIEVFEQACPKFVPLIEGREILTEVQDDTSVKDSSQARMTEEDRKAKQMMQDTFLQLIIKQYLDPLLHNNIDTLLLGCTHYELIQDQIKQQLPPTVTLISEGTTCATKLKEYLNRHHEIEETLTQNRQLTLNFTLDTKEYREKASAYLS
jgi:glutamate racemase